MLLFLQFFYSIETFKVKSGHKHTHTHTNEEAPYALMGEKLQETLATFCLFVCLFQARCRGKNAQNTQREHTRKS